jgi:hypothetical protein
MLRKPITFEPNIGATNPQPAHSTDPEPLCNREWQFGH